MKILLDGRLWGLENAGLGRYLMGLVEGLKHDNKNHYVILLRQKYFDKLKFSGNWEKYLADFRHYSLAEQLNLPRIISEVKPDLVHFPHFNIPVFYNGPFIVTIHDLLMHKQKGLEATTLNAPTYFLKRLGYRTAIDKAIMRSKAIIVPSKSVKNEILSEYKVNQDKIIVIYEGVSKDLGFEDCQKPTDPYFIYTGNAYPHKNLRRLIETIQNMNNKYTQKINLAIVSSRNIFIDRLNLLIRKIGAQDHVKLIGFVPDKNLGYLYKNARGFIFPSLSEGFGLPGLEAMKSGTIVLASQIPVFREIYQKHAIYFNQLDADSICNAILECLRMGDSERKKRIKDSQDFITRYSWVNMAKETLKLYEKI